MTNEVLVRTARPEDAAAIAEIYSESILARDSTMDIDPWTEETALGLLHGLTERETVVVLEAQGVVTGWGIVKKYSDRPGYRVACETSLYVRRGHSGRGYGSAIQTKLHRRARRLGYHHIVAKIWADNERSVGMHRKMGFEMVGIQREIGLVDGIRRDIALMQRILDGDDNPA
ncbi:MAG: N-acetyltransferase [Rhodothermales bacterium]|nr:N-acetyltransferase [Rhodothermales bacterium]